MQCVFSNDLNTLVETVARVLSSPSEVSPLTPDWIIVPNQDTGRWLQIQLTDRLGSLSNTQMHFDERHIPARLAFFYRLVKSFK